MSKSGFKMPSARRDATVFGFFRYLIMWIGLGEFRAYMEDLELTTNFAARINHFFFV